MSQKKPWRKVLYEKQDFPDNYVDESFLKDLQKNLHVKYYTKVEAVSACTIVSMEICCVAIFVLAFIYLDVGRVHSKEVFIGSSLLTACLYFLNIFYFGSQQTLNKVKSAIIEDFRSTGIFLLFGYSLSPILKTLTDTISTDTIYAMSASMLLLHLICHDYGVPGFLVSTSVSFNSALFATVCLGSRLRTINDAFVLLTFSLEIFALFPLFRKRLEDHSSLWLVVTAILFLCAFFGLLALSFIYCLLFVLIITFVNIICPLWYVKWQSYKENLHGPWDEAIIDS